MAIVYRCRHRTRAGRPATRNARGGALQGWHAQLLAAADCQRILAAVAHAAYLLRAGAGISSGQSLRSAQRIAAANGQFLLVEREAYRKLGGHASVADKVLEDVELANLAKRRRIGLRFRYADDAVSARMYRSTAAMIEGWTKNLKLLFDNSVMLAVWRTLDFLLLFGLPILAYQLWNARFGAHGLQWLGAGWVLALLWLRTVFRFYARVAKSNFPFIDCAIAPLGLPLFVALLYRSWFQHRILKRVSWKGRSYTP